MKNIKNKKIAIIGIGISGYAAALLAKKKGAVVYLSEYKNDKTTKARAAILRREGIQVELGGHSLEFLDSASYLITSPGIKGKSLPLKWAKKNKIPILSEIEFASWFSKVPIIAITGSNGKSTVTTLIGRILKLAGKRVFVGGNIGIPYSNAVLDENDFDVMVLEVSSFQLQFINLFCPKVRVILNITQNHLDYHKTFDRYFKAKKKIMDNQRKSDLTILNFDDQKLLSLSKRVKSKLSFFSRQNPQQFKYVKGVNSACWVDNGTIIGIWKNKIKSIIETSKLGILGVHNIENAMAAILAVKAFGVTDKIIQKALITFKSLPHRCELILRIGGVDFINDSKSTTVDATYQALNMFADKKVILICGGRNKGSDFRPLKPILKKKVSKVILMGESKDEMEIAFKNTVSIVKADSLQKALLLAKRAASSGDSVFFSPMCASFDMFRNFEHRGKEFKKEVKNLRKK